jgi:hypothetical protein
MNSGVQFLNNGQTYRNLDKHNCYDVLARAMHPCDRHPTTVLLPEFYPYTPDQDAQMWWEHEQKAIAGSTRHGFDPQRRATDWEQVRSQLDDFRRLQGRLRGMRASHYPADNYLKEAVDRYFGGRFPLYLKTAFGFGGREVYRVDSLDELYAAYDRTTGAFHLQEAIEEYDVFVRCMGVGPQVLFMRYRPGEAHHLHYSEERLELEAGTGERLRSYVRFVDAYHRWSHNSFEALIKDGSIHPIDYANACPDSSLTSLHVHFPWLICALVRWCTFVVVAGVDLRVDMEQETYSSILNDSTLSPQQKHEACRRLSDDYFRVEEFEEYCRSGLPGLEEAMIRFYDENADRIIDQLIRSSDFPAAEHERFIREYREKMDAHFRRNAKEYLTAGAPC